MKNNLIFALAVLVVASAFIFVFQYRSIERLKAERDRYKGNTETLFSEVEKYKVRDSLNAARIESLELTAREYEKFRSADLALIKTLTGKNRDLVEVNKTQTQTILALQSVPKDTIIIRDSVPIPAVAVHCGDAWYDFDGLLTEDTFTGTLANRDSLVIVESVQYKRFLGFLWKTHKVKNRRVDCVSRNPHTEIKGVEHILISQ